MITARRAVTLASIAITALGPTIPCASTPHTRTPPARPAAGIPATTIVTGTAVAVCIQHHTDR